MVVRTPGIVFLVVHLWRLSVAIVKTVVRHPIACAVVGAVTASLYLLGWRATMASLGVLAYVLLGWRALEPRSFARFIAWPAVGWWRWMWIYRRKWRAVMAVTGLAQQVGGRRYLPDLVKVKSDRYMDMVTVKMLSGQDVEAWAARSGNLAHGFGAVSCRVSSPRPGRALLVFRRHDALAATVPARPLPVKPSVGPVPVGLSEDGRAYRLRLHGTHVLIAGATGAGKGSWLWSAVRGLLPASKAGLVRLWALDPKRMELSYGRALFHRYAAKPHDCALLLELAVEVMQERADRYAGVRRDHEATVEDPFIVVIVDEVAFLTAYQPDKQLRARIMAALATLTTQGRAVGVCVLAALQDPRKDVLSIRNLFPDRVALRLDEPEQVDMVLGDGARDRGALADQIPRDADDPSVGAGVGYVRLENSPDPIRVRAAYVSDDDIKQMLLRYSAVGEAV